MSDSRVPDDWQVIVDTHDGPEADIIRGRLEDEGIEVVVLASRGAPGAWLTGAEAHWAPKSIAVPVSEAERALELLTEEGLDDLGEGADLEEEEDLGTELGSADEYPVEDVDSSIGTFSEPLAQPSTMMGWLRVGAWVIAGLVVVGLLFPQCSGIL